VDAGRFLIKKQDDSTLRPSKLSRRWRAVRKLRVRFRVTDDNGLQVSA
jgi:hypothetical protein